LHLPTPGVNPLRGEFSEMKNPYTQRPGRHPIFVKWITRNGQRIYPKNGKCFVIWVKN
jgi:hypothetical protein